MVMAASFCGDKGKTAYEKYGAILSETFFKRAHEHVPGQL